MSDWPDLASLALLVAIADHGSLSAAARHVGMAQPNATRTLARLERDLGLSLVQRSTAGSTPTSNGTLVVEWARPLLQAAEDLLDGAAVLAYRSEQQLTVAASHTIAEQLLPGWLVRLRDDHPQLQVAVHVHNSADVVDDLHHGRCTLGFIEGPTVPWGMHSVVVARDELVLVVAPTHPWARRRRPVEASELLATALVTREQGSGTRVALDAALGSTTTSQLELPSNAAVRIAVSSGAGPAVLSRLAVTEALRSKDLVQVPVAGVDLGRRLRAVWTGRRRLAGPARDLVDLARSDRLT